MNHATYHYDLYGMTDEQVQSISHIALACVSAFKSKRINAVKALRDQWNTAWPHEKSISLYLANELTKEAEAILATETRN